VGEEEVGTDVGRDAGRDAGTRRRRRGARLGRERGKRPRTGAVSRPRAVGRDDFGVSAGWRRRGREAGYWAALRW
jgi:hypothetical protein